MIILTIILGYLVVCGISLIIVLNVPYYVIKNTKRIYDEEDIIWAYNMIDKINSIFTVKTILLTLPFIPWLFIIGFIQGINDNKD